MYALTEVLAFVTCTGPAGDLVKYSLIQQVRPGEHRGITHRHSCGSATSSNEAAMLARMAWT